MRTHHLASLLIPPLCSLILGGCTGGDASSSSASPASPPSEEVAQKKEQESEQTQKPDYEQMIKKGRAFSPAITSSTEYSTTDCDEAAPDPWEDSLSPEERRFTVECILEKNQAATGIYEDGGNVFWKKPDGTVQQITKTGGQTGVGGCSEVVKYVRPAMSADSRFVAFIAECGALRKGMPGSVYLKDLARGLLAEIMEGEIVIFVPDKETELSIYDRGTMGSLPPDFDIEPLKHPEKSEQTMMFVAHNLFQNIANSTPTVLAENIFPYEVKPSDKFHEASKLIETFSETKLDSITDLETRSADSWYKKYGAEIVVEATVAYTKRAQKMERDGSVSLAVKTFRTPLIFAWKDFRWHLVRSLPTL